MYNEIGVLFRIFMNDQNKRLNILTAKEIQALYGIPQFTPEERITYFTLDPLEEEQLKNIRYINAAVYFILQLGYFKAFFLTRKTLPMISNIFFSGIS